MDEQPVFSPTSMPPVPHGGNLAAATERFGEPADGWLDLSTGISPFPYPHTGVSPDSLHRLPDDTARRKLHDAARRQYDAPMTAHVAAAPGTQAILQALPAVRAGAHVAVLSPTYGEHARVWRDAGCRVTEISTLDQADGADIIVVVNPNNPDGRITPSDRLLGLADRLAGRNGLLIVDEAFSDITPSDSLAPHAEQQGLLILRSFGKFFGLAGLRLGMALGTAQDIAALENRLGPWAVSGPALEIGARALNDEPWIAATRDALAAASKRLEVILGVAKLPVIGGTDLFKLVETPDAPHIYDNLGRMGILVRPFSDRPGWLRFGLPGDAAAEARLTISLQRAAKQR